MARLSTAAALLAALAASASCGSRVDVTRALQATDVSTGWFDAGIVDGKNKLVPSITFRLRNSSDEALTLQMNVVYMILPEKEERDDVFLQAIRVPASGASQPVTVRSKYGFTGAQPRAEMLQHTRFQDFQVRLFVKHGSSQWIPIGDYPVARQLLTR